jgi:hypothetical protein
VYGLLLYDSISLLFLFLFDMGLLFFSFFHHALSMALFLLLLILLCIAHVYFARIFLEREVTTHVEFFLVDGWMEYY